MELQEPLVLWGAGGSGAAARGAGGDDVDGSCKVTRVPLPG